MSCNKLNSYIEVAPPQVFDDEWKEFKFDLVSNHNLIHDIVIPESGSGYVFNNPASTNPLTRNRVLFWRVSSHDLELVELSAEFNLTGNQVRITFNNSPIISSVNIIEFSNSIVLLIATLTSVHKIHLPHPNTSTNKSVLASLTQDILYNPNNYYFINNTNNSSMSTFQPPTCVSSWIDNGVVKFALSFPSSTINIIQLNLDDNSISSIEIKRTGIIERLWQKMPTLLARSQSDFDNAPVATACLQNPINQEWLLLCFCRDYKLRVISTVTNECILTQDVIDMPLGTIPFMNRTSIIMKVSKNYMALYSSFQEVNFSIFKYSCKDGIHSLDLIKSFTAPQYETLIDYNITDERLWVLADLGESNLMLAYNKLARKSDWKFIGINNDIDPILTGDQTDDVFWRNKFTTATISRAIAAFSKDGLPKVCTMEYLHKYFNDHFDIYENEYESFLTKFYEYCIQNHHTANKVIGLASSTDEKLVGITKSRNASIICPTANLSSYQSDTSNYVFRGIEDYSDIKLSKCLDFISNTFLDEHHSKMFDKQFFADPKDAYNTATNVVSSRLKKYKLNHSSLGMKKGHEKSCKDDIEKLLNQLDITEQSEQFYLHLKSRDLKKQTSENFLNSNLGVSLTQTMFNQIVSARYHLSRDLLILIKILEHLSKSEQWLQDLCQDMYMTLSCKAIQDCLKSYAVLVWICQEPIKRQPKRMSENLKAAIEIVGAHFEFFTQVPPFTPIDEKSSLNQTIHRNLVTHFLANGGSQLCASRNSKTLSESDLVLSVSINLCKLLWPQSKHICFHEYLITNNLDEHLRSFIDLTSEWVKNNEADLDFVNALCCLMQSEHSRAVQIFNTTWLKINPENLLGRLIGLDNSSEITINAEIIHKSYVSIIKIFQAYENVNCLIEVINQCIELLGKNCDDTQERWVNSFRTQLFKYYLEQDQAEEAYHAMVLNSDQSLRTNCLHQFIVHLCERKRWQELLTYPFIDIRDDFIRILNQRAAMSDLSKQLEQDKFNDTSYYDLLFSSFISGDCYKEAANVAYNYYSRCAQEVRGVLSVQKQVDTLLLCLNALRCIEDQTCAFIDIKSSNNNEDNEDRSVLKRTLDDSDVGNQSRLLPLKDSDNNGKIKNRLYPDDIKQIYELTNARLRLVEKDPKYNSIALSPLKVDETIIQLVESSMFGTAMDLALLFRSPMQPIISSLTTQYIFQSQLSESQLMLKTKNAPSVIELFSNNYSNIETYSYIINAECSESEKLWRLIIYYLNKHDGVFHMNYNSSSSGHVEKSKSTLLLGIVARKLLESGLEIPADLKNAYKSRYTSELLRMLIRFDKLSEAAELAEEMFDVLNEPSRLISTSQLTDVLPPVYMPTHLVIKLLEFLLEDATNNEQKTIASSLEKKLQSYYHMIKA